MGEASLLDDTQGGKILTQVSLTSSLGGPGV